MIDSKEITYAKAYAELNEIIKKLSKDDQDKIPDVLKSNLVEKMDKNYQFNFNADKDITEQNYMLETRAMFIKIYEKYLASENEKEFWSNYDRICFNMIEDEKKEKFNTGNLFEPKKTDTITEIVPIIEKKENIFFKIIDRLKNILKK